MDEGPEVELGPPGEVGVGSGGQEFAEPLGLALCDPEEEGGELVGLALLVRGQGASDRV